MFPLTDPILVFTILIAVILLAPLLAGRLRIPDLVLLLLAGTLLGPHGFGVLARDAAVTLFGAVGLLYIMFIAGLDIDLYRFGQTRGRSIAFGLLTFALPQALGMLLGRYLLGFSWMTSILLASLFASHTLLAYPIASRLGIARRETVAVTVGATIITDILALLVLAVIADLAKGIELDVRFWVGIVLGLLVMVWLAWKAIPCLSRWFFHRVPEQGGAQFLFVLTVVCGFAYLSHFAKMEPIIGAFMAGVAFNRLIPEQSVLMNRVQFAGHTLFIPFFLISVGMLVDPGALLTSLRGWQVAAAMIWAVVVSKWLAAHLAARLFGYRRQDGQVMFGLSVVQAAATLAAVLVGFNLEIFDATVLNGAIAMILVTCLLGAWCVDHYGRALAGSVPAARPAPRRTQRLLVPVSSPASAVRLLDLAFLLRDDSQPGEVQPVTVVREDGDLDEAVAAGEKLLADCLGHAAAADRSVNPGLRVALNAGDGIVRAALELRSDAVVMGWGGGLRGVPRIFGTVLETIIDQCPARIILCRLVGPLNTTRRVLLPLPPLAERCADIDQVLRDAKWLARQIGADLHVYLSAPAAAAQLQAKVESIRPATATLFQKLPDWRRTRTRLFADLQPDDLIVLPAGRRHGSFWMPGLERLPEILAARFPRLNLLAIYPPLSTAAENTASQETAAGQTFEIVAAGDTLAATGIDDMLPSLVEAIPALTELQRREVLALLRHAAAAYPVEMLPGVVILHGHSTAVDRPRLAVGVAERPLTFPGLSNPARVVLTLVSPVERTGELHLKALADLAGRFRRPGIPERLPEAASAAEAQRLLTGP